MKAANKYAVLSFFLLMASACGGGSSGPLSVAGTWSGQLFQASSVICADGPLGGVGFGVPTAVLTLQIRGAGQEGSALEAEDGSCIYRGIFMRDEMLELFGDEAACRRRLELRFLSDSSLEVFFPAQTPSPGICTIAEEGVLEKLRVLP